MTLSADQETAKVLAEILQGRGSNPRAVLKWILMPWAVSDVLGGRQARKSFDVATVAEVTYYSNLRDGRTWTYWMKHGSISTPRETFDTLEEARRFVDARLEEYGYALLSEQGNEGGG